jgi:hypothetical protein
MMVEITNKVILAYNSSYGIILCRINALNDTVKLYPNTKGFNDYQLFDSDTEADNFISTNNLYYAYEITETWAYLDKKYRFRLSKDKVILNIDELIPYVKSGVIKYTKEGFDFQLYVNKFYQTIYNKLNNNNINIYQQDGSIGVDPGDILPDP